MTTFPRLPQKIILFLNLNGAHGRQQLVGVFRHWEHRRDRPLRIIQLQDDFIRECREVSRTRSAVGMIIGSPADDRTIAQATGLQVPVVLVDIPIQATTGRESNVSHIRIDNEAIGRLAAQYLHGLGNFRSFAYLPYATDCEWSAARGRAFACELKKRKRPLKIFPGDGQTVLSDWIASLPKPVALFAANDARALQALEAANEANVRIPDQLVLLGVDDDELLCEQAKPSLSSVRPDHLQEGVLAAREMDRLLAKRKTPSRKTQRCSAATITERESTRTPAPAAQLMVRARTIISKEAVNGLTPDVLASRLGVSRRLLDLRFHEFSSKTVAETILDRKLDSFRTRLLQTSESIASLARKCGFTNVNSLRNLFLKRYGQSPREARRSHKAPSSRATFATCGRTATCSPCPSSSR